MTSGHQQRIELSATIVGLVRQLRLKQARHAEYLMRSQKRFAAVSKHLEGRLRRDYNRTNQQSLTAITSLEDEIDRKLRDLDAIAD